MTVSDPALEALARQHMPELVAERWIALQRPAVRLRAAGPGEAVVARLSGEPALPTDVGWPRWKGEGWLNFVAAIDCGALPSEALDIPLPTTGKILLFYRDPEADDYQTIVDPLAPHTQAGARVVFVPEDMPTSGRQTPDGVRSYTPVPLTADVVVTGPDWHHPEFQRAIQDLPRADREFMSDPLNSDQFGQAIADQLLWPHHRVGGYAYPIQWAVELQIAMAALGRDLDYDDPAVIDEARQWKLLAQINNDPAADMRWGDFGALYWFIRPDDLERRRFDAAMFAWQTG